MIKFRPKNQFLFTFCSINLVLVILLTGILILKSKSGGTIINEQQEYNLVESLLKPLDAIYFHLYFAPNKLPQYQLVYRQADFDQLAANLPTIVGEQELSRHLTVRNFITGKFYDKNYVYNVEISIKGEALANYINPKKSLRIKFKNGNFKGRQIWDFVVPEQRRFNSAGASAYLASKLGVLTQQWDYAWLKVNNDQMGVYELVDETDTSFLEYHNLSPSDIVYRENKSPWIISGSGGTAYSVFEPTGEWQLENKPNPADPAPFSAIETLKKVNELQGNDFFTQFAKIVDMDEFLKWSAIHYLLNDQHQDNLNNDRVVFVKEKGQLWFMPDHFFVQPITTFVDTAHRHSLDEKVLSSPDNFWKRNKIIWSLISNTQFKSDLNNYLDSKINLINAPIYQDPQKAFRYLTYKSAINSQKQIINSNIDAVKQYFDTYHISVYTTNYSSDTSNPLLASSTMLVSNFFQPQLKTIKINFDKSVAPAVISVYWDMNGDGQIDHNDQKIGDFNIGTSTNQQSINVDSPVEAAKFDRSVYDAIRPIATAGLLFQVDNKDSISITSINLTFANSLTGAFIDATNQMIDPNISAGSH